MDTAFTPPQPIELTAGQSHTPADDTVPLMVAAGECEVYAHINSRRLFLGVASSGTLIVPPDGAAAGLSLLAPVDCRLAAVTPDLWAHARSEKSAPAIDRWCALLSARLGELYYQRPSVQPLAADETVTAEAALAVTAGAGVIWITARGGAPLRLMGDREMPADAAVPVNFHSWLTAEAGTRLSARTTAAVTAAGRERESGGEAILAGLRAYGTAVAELAEAFADMAEAREMVRVERRDEQVDQALVRGFERFYRIFADNKMAPPHENDCAFVYRALTGQVPAPQSVAAQTDDFELFTSLNDARLRTVPLVGDWWKRDVGPLAARRASDGKLVAVKTDWFGRYKLHASDEAPRRVNRAVSATLEAHAQILTRPLPNQAVSIKQIVLMGLALCSVDMWTLAAAVFASSLLGLLLPIATGSLVDTYIPSALREPLLMIGLGLIVAQAGMSAINLTCGVLRLRMDGRIAEMVGGGTMDRVLRLPGAATRNMASAELWMRVSAVDGIRRSIMGVVLNALMSGVSGLSGIALLTWYSPLGGAVALALAAAVVGIGVLTGLKQVDSILKGDQMTINVSAFALQIIDNMPVLRAFAAERRAFARWVANSAEMRARTMRSKTIGNIFEAILAAFQILAVAVIFAVLGYSLGPGVEVSTGGYMVFVSTFQTFLAAGMIISRGANQILNIKPQLAMALPLLNNAPEAAQHTKDPGDISGALEVNNVSFETETGKQILKAVSFRAAAGSFVALVGPSGSGKSTLISLLIGFEAPSSGSVRYDGRDLASLNLTKLRRRIGYVRQNGRLFAGTLRENIQGPHVVDLDAVWRAAEMAGVADDIRAMPMGLHTVVTEGASVFSGGQIQRLLLARALIGSPKILLLDEATSALDNLSQAHVTRSIDALGATRVVVAHRLSTVRHADMILFIDQGKIVESGTMDELLRQGGAFARYAQLQTL